MLVEFNSQIGFTDRFVTTFAGASKISLKSSSFSIMVNVTTHIIEQGIHRTFFSKQGKSEKTVHHTPPQASTSFKIALLAFSANKYVGS